jgi:hypothetical protein
MSVWIAGAVELLIRHVQRHALMVQLYLQVVQVVANLWMELKFIVKDQMALSIM